ncbi:hypothetical protein ACFO4E_27125 [Nocardiopsis mangrovi]|uniref:Uncharacterized protein n=1 Tax=Nocardiopsis mangrovi TaxID=1179818 RepID=A0ABV9E321_9ACTN
MSAQIAGSTGRPLAKGLLAVLMAGAYLLCLICHAPGLSAAAAAHPAAHTAAEPAQEAQAGEGRDAAAGHGHAEPGHCDDSGIAAAGQPGGGLQLLMLLGLATLAAWVLWSFPPRTPAWAHPRPWRRHPGGSRLLISICVCRV